MLKSRTSDSEVNCGNEWEQDEDVTERVPS